MLKRYATLSLQPDLLLPCGSCLSCRLRTARDWSIRCQLELQQHSAYCWATLTYDEQHRPPTLSKRHLQKWLKRLRARHEDRTIRFFAAGEYGETTKRPHYHAILYGLPEHPSIQDTWPFGYVQTDRLTPAAISYVAGYCHKKIGYAEANRERVDPETGEVYLYQPPFLQMSRRPGIGGHAREHWRSWSESAIWHNQPVPVPRFLHQSFLNNASPAQLSTLQSKQLSQKLSRSISVDQHASQVIIDEAKLTAKKLKRKL